jgi:rhodanese/phosphatase family protein
MTSNGEGAMGGDDPGRKLDALHATFGDHGVPRAIEDLPAGSWDKVPGLVSAPEKHPLWERVLDELADLGLDSYGDLETVPLLHFLSQYPVTAYTYPISPVLSRGERPSLAKLRDLAGQGYRRTVSLCAETKGGDTPLITRAGLTGTLETAHVPIVDMHNPTLAQVVQLLDLLTAPGAPRTYLHCEAGRCRTGVMVACYRMAVMGWDEAAAFTEAENFGCSVPLQRAFIEKFAIQLTAHAAARAQHRADSAAELGRYPLKPMGSVRPTPAEREATLGAVAKTERGGVE